MSDISPVLPSGELPPSRRFRLFFVATLAIVVILLTVGQIVTQHWLHKRIITIKIVRIAALQRHQSQAIAKKALLLTRPSNGMQFRRNLAELKELASQFEANHRQVREGSLPDELTFVEYSDSLRERYRQILPYFEALRSASSQFIRKADKASGPATLNANPELSILLANEAPFLAHMDGIIQQHNRETLANLTLLKRLDLYLYVFTLMVLLVIGWWILLPALHRLGETIQRLVEAQNQTSITNRKLLSLNRTLKETRQQLFEATRQQYEQQMDEQKLRTSYLMAGQEEERKRLSRDLHDGLGQMLTAIKLQVESLEMAIQSGRDPQNMQTLKTLIAQTIQETRNVSDNLMPTVLSDFGLVPGIRMLADSASRNSLIKVRFETSLPDTRLDKNTEIGLYRITQEALSNAIRHARPQHITIDLFEKDEFLHLLVCDDGVGFRVQRTNKNAPSPNGRVSQGIQNMQQRAGLINARFRITSAPDKGTKVHISIPFKPVHQEHEYNEANAGR